MEKGGFAADTKKKMMKRVSYHIFGTFLTILLLTTVSCSDRHDGHEVAPAAIGFYSHRLAEVGKKALVEDNAGLQGSGFGVFAYKVMGAEKPIVFGNTAVSYSGGWTYEPTRYWDRARHYLFAAYSPHTLTDAAFSPADGTLTLSNIPQWQQVSTAKDYLVANSSGAATDYLALGGTVTLEFKHILAQLLINVIKESSPTMDKRTYTVDSLRLGDATVKVPTAVDANKRSYTYSAAAVPATGVFTPSTPSATGVMDFTDAAGKVAATTQTTLAHYLVAPFVASGNMSLYIDYTIHELMDPSLPDIVKTNEEVPLDIDRMEANSKYVFLLRFEAGKKVAVKVLQIKDWDAVEVTDDVYNW